MITFLLNAALLLLGGISTLIISLLLIRFFYHFYGIKKTGLRLLALDALMVALLYGRLAWRLGARSTPTPSAAATWLVPATALLVALLHGGAVLLVARRLARGRAPVLAGPGGWLAATS